jgi:hypothetical protein
MEIPPLDKAYFLGVINWAEPAGALAKKSRLIAGILSVRVYL